MSALRVLHIYRTHAGADATDATSANVTECLKTYPIDVVSAPDVYRGLARICVSREMVFSAVVVCVNEFYECEFEFFSLIARIRPELAVYVYGRPNSTPRLARALQLGAVGVFDESSLRSIAEGKTPHAEIPNPVSPAVGPSETGESAEEVTPMDDIDEEICESSAMESNSEPIAEEESSGARVPWGQYSTLPSRKPPAKPRTAGREVSQPKKERARRQVFEGPLLTQEELRALLDDDIAAISPEKPPSASDNDPPFPGKSR